MSGGASKQLRKYIIATDPTAIAIKARIKELNDLLSNDLEELNDVWKAEAKQQPTAIDLANQIA